MKLFIFLLMLVVALPIEVAALSSDPNECTSAELDLENLPPALDCVVIKPQKRPTWGDLASEFLGRSEYGKSYAILIGISRYENEAYNIPVEKDPVRVARVLADEMGYDHIRILTEENATREKLRTLLTEEYAQIGKKDRLLVYWVGHGHSGSPREGRKEDGYFVLHSSKPNSVASMLKMTQVSDWVNDYISAEQVLFVIDACFSGYVGNVAMSSPSDKFIGPSRELLLASASDQPTFATYRPRGGAFTRQFIKGIRGAADTIDSSGESDGVVTSFELISHLIEGVRSETNEHSWKENLNPQLLTVGERKGSYFFVPNSTREKSLQSDGYDITNGYTNGVPNAVPISIPELRLADEITLSDRIVSGDWSAIVLETDAGKVCVLKSNGVSALNAYIASGLSSLVTLSPYRDAEVSGIVIERVSGSEDEVVRYINQDFLDIYPSAATSFDVDVLDIWLNDDIQREYVVKPNGLDLIGVSISSLEPANILRIRGYRDASSPEVAEFLDHQLAYLNSKYGEELPPAILRLFYTEYRSEAIIQAILQNAFSVPVEGGLKTDIFKVREKLEEFISEPDVNADSALNNFTDGASGILGIDQEDELEETELDRLQNDSYVAKLALEMPNEDLAIIVQMAEAKALAVTFVDRISLYGISHANKWLTQVCD